MDAGKLRHLLYADEPVTARSPSGAVLITWTPRFSCWASIEPIRGREFFSRDQIRDDIDVRIMVRGSPEVESIGPEWRLRDERGHIYNIRSIANIRLLGKEVEIMASSGLNKG